MKFWMLSLLLLIGGWYLHQNGYWSLSALTSPEGGGERQLGLEAKDGRRMDCTLVAKEADFIVISREADRQIFLVNIDSLSNRSRRQLNAMGDFNTEAVEVRLFQEAKKVIQVELQYVPALTYFQCSYGSLRQKSCEGLEVDRFRSFLQKTGLDYRETTLSTRPAENEGFVYLPDGVKSVPCIQIGSERLYARDERELRQLITDAYVIKLGTAN